VDRGCSWDMRVATPQNFTATWMTTLTNTLFSSIHKTKAQESTNLGPLGTINIKCRSPVHSDVTLVRICMPSGQIWADVTQLQDLKAIQHSQLCLELHTDMWVHFKCVHPLAKQWEMLQHSHGIGRQANAHSCVRSCKHPAVNTLVLL
jgi:hypothetical protein